MGWSATVTSDRLIKEAIVEEIVNGVPEDLGSHMPTGFKVRQAWGWSSGVDISNPDGNTIRLSGSYGISGKIAEPYAAFFADALRERGHQVTVDFYW
jgi:predicted NUDIX family NTP pyrophosphohydrolase